MLRRADTVTANGHGSKGHPEGASSASRPNVSGDIDDLLSPAPAFRLRHRGYDRLQVDNYVSWAESELAAARRQADHLLSRYGASSAELEISRRLLAEASKARVLSPVSERVTEILRLAGEEAAATVEAAHKEADQFLAGARMEADARLRKAHEIKEAAVAAADELRHLAQAERTEARVELGKARAQASDVLRDAKAEHAWLTEQVAEARAELVATRAEVDDLRRERDEARELLTLLNDRIGQALAAVGDAAGERFVLVGNRAQAVPT